MIQPVCWPFRPRPPAATAAAAAVVLFQALLVQTRGVQDRKGTRGRKEQTGGEGRTGTRWQNSTGEGERIKRAARASFEAVVFRGPQCSRTDLSPPRPQPSNSRIAHQAQASGPLPAAKAVNRLQLSVFTHFPSRLAKPQGLKMLYAARRGHRHDGAARPPWCFHHRLPPCHPAGG